MAKSGNSTQSGNWKDGPIEQSQKKEKESSGCRGAWADHSSRFPIDQLLRKHGYIIWERKHKKEPIWKNRKGEEILQSEILHRLPPNEVDDAEMVDNLFSKGIEDE